MKLVILELEIDLFETALRSHLDGIFFFVNQKVFRAVNEILTPDSDQDFLEVAYGHFP